MKINDAAAVLRPLVQAAIPVLLAGPPGVGKTDVVWQTAQAASHDLIINHPVVNDPTDMKGLPWPDAQAGVAKFLPYGDLARILNATRPTIVFFDDIGQATAAVQASVMQLVLARRIGEHQVPDCVTFVAATNRKADRAGVGTFIEPLKARFAILNVETDLDGWTRWAYENDVPPELIAFLRFRPELLHMPSPSHDIVNTPSPRTWAMAGRVLSAGVPESLLIEPIRGSVGEGPALELLAFRKLYLEMPNPDAIIVDPEHAPIPSKPDQLFALVVALAKRATAGSFGRLVRYAERLQKENLGEFAALMLRDAQVQCPEVTKSYEYTRLAIGPLQVLFQ